MSNDIFHLPRKTANDLEGCRLMPKHTLKLSVPDEYRDALSFLVKLGPDKRTAFLNALKETPPHLRLATYAAMVSQRARMTAADTRPLVEMFTSMYHSADLHETPPNQFARQVQQAAEAEGMTPETGTWEDIADLISQVLALHKSVGVVAKAADVIFENQHTFCEARILTDLRGVFKPTVDDRPEAGFIIHNLRITYHLGEELNEFFVALTPSDLRELLELIERATRKEKSLASAAKDGGLTVLDS